jgi:hypothetical protein
VITPEELLTRTVITATTEFVKQPIQLLFNTWIKPKLEEKKRENNINTQLEKFVFEVFNSYLTNAYEALSYVNVIALSNKQVRVDDIYIPSTITQPETSITFTLDKYIEDLEQYGKILIEDYAGMGKSTMMKKLFLSVIEQNMGIPVLIELRYISEKNNIIDIICENVNGLEEEHSKDLIVDIIKRGDFIFFFDGYDEVPFDNKSFVTKHIKDFIKNAGKNTFFMTSRSVDSLTSFGEFQRFKVNEFKKEEAYQLIKNYDNISGLKMHDLVTKQIEESISREQFQEINQFLGNPLLVSFLYLTFLHKQDIPSLKIDFYRKVYDALYEQHDLSKDHYKREKYSKLTNDNLHRVLRTFGFISLMNSKVEYRKDEILKFLNQSIKNCGFNIDESDLLKDLLETVPLITKVGPNYKWSHKSFIEFFAASFLDRSDDKEILLLKISKGSKFSEFENLFSLFYDIDKLAFEKYILYPEIKDFIDYMDEKLKSNAKELPSRQRYYELTYNNIFYYNTDKMPKDIDDFHKYFIEEMKGWDYEALVAGIASENNIVWAKFTTNRRLENIIVFLGRKNHEVVFKNGVNRINNWPTSKMKVIFNSNTFFSNEAELKNKIKIITNNYDPSASYFSYDKSLIYKKYLEDKLKNSIDLLISF